MSSNWQEATSPEHHSDPLREAIHHIVIAEAHLDTASRALSAMPIAKDELRLIREALRAMVDHHGALT